MDPGNARFLFLFFLFVYNREVETGATAESMVSFTPIRNALVQSQKMRAAVRHPHHPKYDEDEVRGVVH